MPVNYVECFGNKLELVKARDTTFQVVLENTDITGWTFYFTVKESVDESAADIDISQSTHSDPTNGTTTIPITDVESDIDEGQYVYEISYVDGSSNRVSVQIGDLTVQTGVKSNF